MRESRMDLDQRIEHHWQSRILVVSLLDAESGEGHLGTTPIVSQSQVEQVFELVSAVNKVQTAEGCVQFLFVRSKGTQFWNNFQYHRRIAAVIGVLSNNSEEDVHDVSPSVEALRKKYEAAHDVYSVVCNKGEAASVTGASLVLNSNLLERGAFDSEAQGAAQKLMEKIGAKLADSYNKKIQKNKRAVERPERLQLLRLPTEHIEASADKTRAFDSHRSKKAQARLQKQTGDLKLLLGKAKDALKEYAMAIGGLKLTNDFLWVGGGNEGCAAALLLEEADREDDTVSRDPEIIAKLREASTLYLRNKGATRLRMEVIFKLAGYFQHKKLNLAALQELSGIFDVAELELDDAECLELFMALGHRHKGMNMLRKAAFYFRRAALCELKFSNWTSTHSILVHIAPVFGLPDLHGYLEGRLNSEKQSQSQGWPMLQALLMRDIMYTAIRMGDTQRVARVAAFFTRTIKEERACKLLPGMLTELNKFPPAMLCPQGLQGVPTIHSLELLERPTHLKVSMSDSTTSVTDSPFIFTPIRALHSRNMQTHWVVGEVGSVKVTLSNPLACDYRVDFLCLYSKGVRFEGYPSSPFEIPAPQNDSSKPAKIEMILEGKPLETGKLHILGCTARSFNADSFHPTNMITISILPSQPRLRIRSVPSFSETNAHLSIWLGQTKTLKYRLQNDGDVPVRQMTLKVELFDDSRKSTQYESSKKSTSDNSFSAVQGFSLKTNFKDLTPILDKTSKILEINVKGESLDMAGFVLLFTYSACKTKESPKKHIRTSSLSIEEKAEPEYSYSRQIRIPLPMSVSPSISIDRVRVVPLTASSKKLCAINGEPSETCLLLLDVRNDMPQACSTTIELKGMAKRTAFIQGYCSEQFHLPMKKMLEYVAPSEMDADKVPSDLSQRISKIFSLTWNLSPSVHGAIPFPTRYVEKDFARQLMKDPLKIEFLVEGKSVSKLSCRAFSLIHVTFQTTNISQVTMPPMIISILPYQDLEKGSRLFEMSGRVEWVGSLEAPIPSLKVGSTHQHTVAFLFPAPGCYHFSCHCRTHKQATWVFGNKPELYTPSMGAAGISELTSSDCIATWGPGPLEIQCLP
eukprot:m.141940 g.141940  ORF g.141940 m.141940 type:complete len:1089 (-) comp14867_c0_seq6:407-3673(-)